MILCDPAAERAVLAGICAYGDSAYLESQHVNNVTGNAQQVYLLGVKKEINQNFAGDVLISNAVTDNTNALSTRIETGGTVTAPLYGIVNGYTRVALGQKYSNTANFTYYSIEPGIAAAVPGVAGLTAKVGYRFRSAFDSSQNNDQTQTARYSLAYALSKVDTVAVKYDRVKGDNNQKVVAVAYTRGF
jgi:hypothetical protein